MRCGGGGGGQEIPVPLVKRWGKSVVSANGESGMKNTKGTINPEMRCGGGKTFMNETREQ